MRLGKLANNAYVLIIDDMYYLFSYETCIAKFNDQTKNLVLIDNYDTYSNTTTKHIYEFCRGCMLNIYDKKDLEKAILNGNILLAEEITLDKLKTM